MELNDLASFTRQSCLAYFKPATGADAGIDIPFGNITAVKLPTNPKTVDATLNKRGGVILAKRDLYQVIPVYEIDSDQFADPTFFIQLMGTKLADLSQSSATGSTFTFTAKAGRAYYIGARNCTIKNVKVASTEATPGTATPDYFIDDPNVTQPANGSLGSGFVSQNGYIIIPVTPGSVITDGATVVVTFDKPALTLNQYSAFTTLNRQGTLTVIAEDNSGGAPREVWQSTVQLSVKDVGDIGDPTKFRTCKLEASIFGNPTITRKP